MMVKRDVLPEDREKGHYCIFNGRGEKNEERKNKTRQEKEGRREN